MACDARMGLVALVALGCSAPPALFTPRDGGRDDGGLDPERCPGLRLEEDGALDLALRAVRVAGVVTLGGAPFGEVSAGRGSLVFTSADGQARVRLPSRGEASFEALLPPDVYDVRFEPAAGCDHVEGQPPVPCAGSVAERVAIRADGALDLDVPTARVRGELRVDGATPPEGDRGELSFGSSGVTSFGGTVARASIARSGLATFDVHLVPGDYDVSHSSTRCEPASALPCGDSRLRTGLAVSGDGALELGLRTVRAQGTLTLDGRPVPEGARGALVLRRTDAETGVSIALPSVGAAVFDVRVAADRYDVGWEPRGACGPTPCVGTTLRRDVELTSDGALDLDLRGLRVAGLVTLRGEALLASDRPRGSIVWIAEDGASHARPLGASGDASYDLVLPPGRYDVAYVAPEGDCATASALPCGGGVLRRSLEISSAGVVDLDLAPVRVDLALTVAGAALPEGLGVSLALRGEGFGAAARVPVERGAPAVTRILPGLYDVVYVPSSRACDAGLPCNGGPLRRAVEVSSDGALSLDVRPVRVSGEVTMGGSPVREAGALTFSGRSADSALVFYAREAPGHFEVTLLPDHYVIAHTPGSECGDATSLPCAGQALAGCTP